LAWRFHSRAAGAELNALPSDLRQPQRERLPALWDADFLYGPKAADGCDSYVLCEINVSSVAPYPDSAAPKVAEATLAGVRAAMAARRN